MKTNTFFLLCISGWMLLLVSCKEDRSGEYLERTEADRWIVEKMKDVYLWYGDIPETGIDYFAVPLDFFPTILSKKVQSGKGDRYSYILAKNTPTRIIDQESSYGFDFILYDDFIGKSNNRYARVIFVLPASPASEAGLKRGDWISGVDNQTLTGDNYGYLYRGGERLFATARIDTVDNQLSWINSDTLTLTASRPVEDNPFYVDTIYSVENKRIAYLMYNHFTPGPRNSANETAYNDRMIRVFSEFKAAGFDDLILDFRYNAGGSLECSRLMASILAPAGALGKTFCSLVYNDKHTESNYKLLLSRESGGGLNLNLGRVYVIVSDLTQFAPEVLINGLIPFMGTKNVILVGTTTNGQNVAVQEVASPYDFTLYPVVATVNNSEGTAGFSKGFSPDKTHTLSETQNYDSLYALGNTKELLLKNTIQLIIEGKMPDVKPEPTIKMSGQHRPR